MESAWLDGRSANGADWKWVSSGFTLSSTKSNITSYPPWADNHPILPSKNNDLYQEGRCLILDRHFCPEHTNPVFLDLDCGKRRPFVCQDGKFAFIEKCSNRHASIISHPSASLLEWNGLPNFRNLLLRNHSAIKFLPHDYMKNINS